ncbi:transmembrane protein 245-like isoform X2 [Penaeus japonicus]|uniref:transmembrane protein 245-like isoform X2 n=1 Tax=Penaeus japonicus TaxID=27405 RepID=UPI001C70E525|nr:transmembrane protein 245-like isoform X2 [Penaeus japonicus]
MSLYGENVRSPLEQVWRQFVPQGYDQALRNAFYNVAAVIFVGAAAAAAWSVYKIFEPFVQPLLWAVLIGSLLHPAKDALTRWTRSWLLDVRASHNLLSVSVALLPLRFLDATSEIVGRFVVRHVRSVVTVTVILPLFYIIIHHTPTFMSTLAYTICSAIMSVITVIVSVVTYNGYAVLTVIFGYLVAVVFFWSSTTCDVLGRMSLAVWVMAAAGMSGLWPAGSVPVFIILCLLLVAGLVTEIMDVFTANKAAKGDDASIIEAAVLVCLGNASAIENATSEGQDKERKEVEGLGTGGSLSPVTEEDSIEDLGNKESPSRLSSIPEVTTTSAAETDEAATDNDLDKETQQESTSDLDNGDQTQLPKEDVSTPVLKPEEKMRQATGEKLHAEDPYRTPLMETPRPRLLLSGNVPSRALPSHGLISPDERPGEEDNGSNMYLKGVLVACILVELWQHNYLLPLLPLAMIYYIIKKVASKYLLWGTALSDVMNHAWDKVLMWAEARKAAILPPPVKGVIKLLVRTDHRLVVALSAGVDAIVTLLLILAVIFFAVTASIFLAVQIQGESMALVTLGSQMINSTVVNNPQFLELLPEGLGDVVSNALDEGYLYGREWIASMLIEVEGSSHPTINATKVVRGMLGETDEAKAQHLEKQVVELWDRVYQAWVSAHPTPPTSPKVTSEAVALSFDTLVDGLRKTSGPGDVFSRTGVVSFSFLSEVLKDNLGTVVSVLESVWTILLGNLSLAVSALTAAASLLLGGSLSLLNALISVVVFMSSLFYVLSASGTVYKPVAVLGNLAPGQMNQLGKAVEDAVNGVFIASLKMGAFYGMWTWLLHSLFSTNIVYIPSVLGALFGAVPLVGTYWAALPGALELCWSQGSPTLALLLFGAQLLPMSCVDTAIYADIKGGSHPYLTGLAVAGGIFYWGAEGAILGPLLLCILKVATNIYSSLIQSPADITRRFGKLRRNPTIT